MESADRAILDRFRPLLQPRHVAVIGASQTPGKAGHAVVQNLIRAGFTGRISPINPAGGTILGLECHRAVAEIAEPVDCAMVVVPAAAAVAAVRDCAAAGVRFVVVGASGFAEAGTADGIARQRDLAQIARRSGMRVVGPNTNGIYNETDALSLGYNVEHGDPPPPGTISIVAHSGALFGGVARNLSRLGFGLAKFIPVGNEADLDMLDFVEYLIADPATRVIGLVIEALSSGPRLRELALRAKDAGKPIVALKVGRSEVGSGAALAHSSRLAGTARAYDELFRACGIAGVPSVEALAGGCAMLASVNDAAPSGDPRLVAITTSGAGGALIADHAGARGIAMAGDPRGEWQGPAGRQIAAMPASGHLRNPLDLGSLANDWQRLNAILAALEAEGLRGPVAAYVHVAPSPERNRSLVAMLGARKARTDAPVVVVAPGGLGDDLEAGYRALGIPLFHDIASGMDTLTCYYARLTPAGPVSAGGAAPAPLAALWDRIVATAGARRVLSELESARILRAAGVPMVESVPISAPDDLAAAAARVGYPLVMKAIAPDVAHKNEAGLVITDIRDAGGAERAFATLEQRLAARGLAPDMASIIVQPMISARAELILGVHEEPPLGHFLVLGFGGIHADFFDYTALIHLPGDAGTIARRVAGSVVGRFLDRIGGNAARRGVCDVLGTLQGLALSHGDGIASIDINPLLVTAGGVVAVDALIVLKSLPVT